MTVYFTENDLELRHGRAVTELELMPASSVSCIVTSPPYYGLRDYGVEGQIGLEDTPAEYVDNLRDVFTAARRVLTEEGTFWLNLGDSYSTPKRGSDEGWDKSRLNNPARVQKAQFASMRRGREVQFDRAHKNLLGMPWRVAFALQDDGWILRNAIIWHKPNAMPESVADRLSCRYEHIFLFSTQRHYNFDLDAVREPHARDWSPGANGGRRMSGGQGYDRGDHLNTGLPDASPHPGGRNPGDVWTVATQPFRGAHFAVMPPAIARRCILAGSKEGDVVLDPFAGSGTTLMVARQLGRRGIGIDVNAEYLDLAISRIGQPTINFREAAQ